MLRLENITYRIGPRVLLDEATVSISAGHRVGLFGRNGVGKTTLLRLITGELDADGGSIDTPPRWQVGVSAQEAPSGARSLIDTVLDADHELANLTAEAETASDPNRIAEIHARLHDKDAYTAPARASRILAGLGFDDVAQQRPCDDYSGGWRMRVALAALLFTEPALLLLDEPTNHLDLEARLWLEDYLRRYAGTVLLVSHDRDLLNTVVGEILHLENGKLTLYQGGYDRFERTRRIQLEQDVRLRVKQDAQRAHIEKFVERFRYKASKAKQAQSRIKMLARMEPIPEHQEEGSVTFAFPAADLLSPPLLSVENAVIGYDDTPVLRHLSFRLDPEDRIALLGANGNGKSTLMKLLAGRLEPFSGTVTRPPKLRVGYFAQHQAEELDMEATPLLALARMRPRDREQQIRSQLGRFGFGQGRAETKIKNLSGGEKARLLFALMTSDAPHILLLDEPTNHLDVLSRQALIQAINDFEGAVVIVSHDPHIIGLTADRFWLIDDGQIKAFDGDLDDYRAFVLGQKVGKDNGKRNGNGAGAGHDDDGEPTGEDNSGINNPGSNKPGLSKKEQRQASADKRKVLASLKKQLTAAETAVQGLETEKAEIRDALAGPGLYEGDSKALRDLQWRFGQVEKKLAAAEKSWLRLQETWDGA